MICSECPDAHTARRRRRSQKSVHGVETCQAHSFSYSRRITWVYASIAGGSGAGKTEYIYRKIIELSAKEPEGRFFVVTPEPGDDAGPEGDRETPPNHGTLNIDIVSFERLAYRIFSELSLPQPEVLDDTGKNMVLRKLAGEKMDELTMFSSHLNRPGFISEIKSMLSELYQYGATPEDLKAQTAGNMWDRFWLRSSRIWK